jgi:hypothetical protein
MAAARYGGIPPVFAPENTLSSAGPGQARARSSFSRNRGRCEALDCSTQNPPIPIAALTSCLLCSASPAARRRSETAPTGHRSGREPWPGARPPMRATHCRDRAASRRHRSRPDSWGTRRAPPHRACSRRALRTGSRACHQHCLGELQEFRQPLAIGFNGIRAANARRRAAFAPISMSW